jgi:hypothetical protein
MKDLLAFIEHRLDAIVSSPKTFGSQEAREAQVILLLDMRSVATGGSGYTASGKMLAFFRENVDDSTSHTKLHQHNLPETLFGKLLAQFIREQTALHEATFHKISGGQ